METEVVRRRMNILSSHFSPNDDLSPAAHLSPMNCSGSLISAIPRYDNGMYFARQGSASQACFMRQASRDQGKSEKPTSALEAPMYSRPTKMEPKLPDFQVCQSQAGHCTPRVSVDPPSFARPNANISRQTQFYNARKIFSSESKGERWSPRMDIVESGQGYVLTIELPGVKVNDLRVEVSDHSLRVKGKRTNKYCMTNGPNYSISAYHKREILLGPFQVTWPLPPKANKDEVSAEFLDGILQIAVPKL